MSDVLETTNGAHDTAALGTITLLSSEESGGAMAVLDITAVPGFSPPRHTHEDADEGFLLLTGEAVFWVAGKTMHKRAGEVAFVPRGVEHSFLVIGDVPCRHLTTFNPGGMEKFFEEMHGRGLRIPQDLEEITKMAGRFQMRFTGPPLTKEDIQ